MNNGSKFSRQSGISLIEVLVSAFIIGVGILGMSGLQTTSLKHNTQSVLRTQAAYLSHEILDRARANPNQNYNIAFGDAPTIVDCVNAECTPEQLAKFDLAEWKCSLGNYSESDQCIGLLEKTAGGQRTNLPESDGAVSCTLVAGLRACLVVIRWQERSSHEDTLQEKEFKVLSRI